MKNKLLKFAGLAAAATLLTIQGVCAQEKAPATPNLKVICAVNIHDAARPQPFPACDKVVNQSAGYDYEVGAKVAPWKFSADKGMGVWHTNGDTPLEFNIIVPKGNSGKLRFLFWVPQAEPRTEAVTVQGKKIGDVTNAYGTGSGEWVEGNYSAEDSKDGKLQVVITKTGGLRNTIISGFEVISTK